MFPGILLFVLLLVPTSADGEPKSYAVVAGKSRVTFDATHPLGDFSGATEVVAGQLRLDPANIPLGVAGRVSADPSSLKTGNDGRDRDLRNTLEPKRYGEIRFNAEEVQSSFPSLAEHADVILRISGVLRIRGVERPTTWTARARLEGARIWVRGESDLKLTDFGITPLKRFFLAVGNGVRAGFDLRLAPAE
jgi:polyisoprenoid-binding protein YceI